MPHVIVHFEIPADDVERAKRFYGHLFGWTFQNRKPLPGEGAEYALIETGGRPNGGLMQRMEPGRGVINCFGVEHLDAYAKKAQALGGVVLLPKTPLPGVGWRGRSPGHRRERVRFLSGRPRSSMSSDNTLGLAKRSDAWRPVLRDSPTHAVAAGRSGGGDERRGQPQRLAPPAERPLPEDDRAIPAKPRTGTLRE